MRKALAGTALALSAILTPVLAAPVAGALPGTPTCEKRSERHYERYGGLIADSLDHVARGELPTCGTEDKLFPIPKEGDDDPQKSRYCRRHWYC